MARIIPLLVLLAGQQKIYIILILVLCKNNWVVLIPKEWFNWVALEEKTLKSIKKNVWEILGISTINKPSPDIKMLTTKFNKLGRINELVNLVHILNPLTFTV